MNFPIRIPFYVQRYGSAYDAPAIYAEDDDV